MPNELPKACYCGSKCKAKGHKKSRNEYKLLIDTANGGIPVSTLLTSASSGGKTAGELRIEQTKSRSHQTQDNALTASKTLPPLPFSSLIQE